MLRSVLLPLVFTLGFTGCGTVVPDLHEPLDGPNGVNLVPQIVQSIHCEVRNAVGFVLGSDERQAERRNRGVRHADWLRKWGVQIVLTLTVKEKTSIEPTIVGMPPSPATALFTITGSGELSSEATRIDKLSYFYTIPELAAQGACPPGQVDRSGSSLLIKSDLKLAGWLNDQVVVSQSGPVRFPDSPAGIFRQDVLSHNVRFQVVTSGAVTPGWKLVRAVVNPSGPFLTASRDRTHDLLVTFGPLDPTQPNALSRPAADSSLASQVGQAISTYSRAFSPF